MTDVSETTVQVPVSKEWRAILVTVVVAGVLLFALFTTGSDSVGSRALAAIAGEPANDPHSILGAGLWWP